VPILTRAYAGAYAYLVLGQRSPSNLPELQQIFRQFSDAQTAEMLNLHWPRLLANIIKVNETELARLADITRADTGEQLIVLGLVHLTLNRIMHTLDSQKGWKSRCHSWPTPSR
jgi:hypothetical protein